MPKAGTSKSSKANRVKLFIEAYIQNGGNATQAAVAAGYKPGGAANKAGYRLSNDVQISTRIKARRDADVKVAEDETGLSIKGTIRELARIVHIDPAKFFDKEGNLLGIHEMPEAARAAIASIEIEERFEGSGDQRQHKGFMKKFKLWDKNSAIEKAMKHLGQFEKDNAQKPPLLPPEIRIVGVRSK